MKVRKGLVTFASRRPIEVLEKFQQEVEFRVELRRSQPVQVLFGQTVCGCRDRDAERGCAVGSKPGEIPALNLS